MIIKSPLRDFFFIKTFGVLDSPLFSTYAEFARFARNLKTKWNKNDLRSSQSIVAQQFSFKRTDVSIKNYYEDFKKVADERLKKRNLNKFQVSAIMVDFDEIFSDHLKSEAKQKSTA